MVSDPLPLSDEALTALRSASKAWNELSPLIWLSLTRLQEWEAYRKALYQGRESVDKLNSMIGLLNGVRQEFGLTLVRGFDIEHKDTATKMVSCLCNRHELCFEHPFISAITRLALKIKVQRAIANGLFGWIP